MACALHVCDLEWMKAESREILMKALISWINAQAGTLSRTITGTPKNRHELGFMAFVCCNYTLESVSDLDSKKLGLSV